MRRSGSAAGDGAARNDAAGQEVTRDWQGADAEDGGNGASVRCGLSTVAGCQAAYRQCHNPSVQRRSSLLDVVVNAKQAVLAVWTM